MNPVNASILFAAAAAAGFFLETWLLAGLWRGPLALHLTTFQGLVAYAVFLAVLRRGPRPDFLPALLIPAAILPFGGPSPWAMAAPAAVALAWLRSGRSAPWSAPGTTLGRLAVEIGCTSGGLLLAAAFRPQGLFGWTLAVWMFFLVQALYFVLCPGEEPPAGLGERLHRFERASARLERAFDRLGAGREETSFK